MTPAKQPSGKATSDMTAPAKKTKQKAKATKPSTSASKNAGKQKASAKKATNNAAVTEPRLAGMGAIVSSDGVGFRVWAPNANTVSVIGHFNDWADDADRLASEGNGFWYGFVKGAKAGDEYKFLLTNGDQVLTRIDPYAFQVTNSVGNGLIYDHGAFDWQGD